MRSALLLLLILTVTHLVVSAPAPDSDKYTTRYDSIDVNGILRSERLLRNYFNCLMDKGPCTREGLELKSELHMQGLLSSQYPVYNIFYLDLLVSCKHVQSLVLGLHSIYLHSTCVFWCLPAGVVRNFALHISIVLKSAHI
jgi:hypothetical protein